MKKIKMTVISLAQPGRDLLIVRRDGIIELVWRKHIPWSEPRIGEAGK